MDWDILDKLSWSTQSALDWSDTEGFSHPCPDPYSYAPMTKKKKEEKNNFKSNQNSESIINVM